jgi:hypothetical protein
LFVSSKIRKIDSFLSAIVKASTNVCKRLKKESEQEKSHQKIILICSATTTNNFCCPREKWKKIESDSSLIETADCLPDTRMWFVFFLCVRNYPNMCVNICLFSFSLITAAAQYFFLICCWSSLYFNYSSFFCATCLWSV